MFAYCIHELHLCEQAAFNRIRAARTARQFPAVFAAVAEGRLHLSAVVLLSPHLTPENADQLQAAATFKSKAETTMWPAGAARGCPGSGCGAAHNQYSAECTFGAEFMRARREVARRRT